MKQIVPARTAQKDWRDTLTWYTYETRLARLAKLVGGPFFRAMARVECSGLENIPARGPCILAVNHLSGFDIIFVGLYVPRHPHFMAKVELYRYPLFRWAIRQGGSFPVYRGEGDVWALEQAGRILAAGQMLCMFPEGTRSGGKGQLGRGKVGTVRLALQHHVPVIPAAIWGTQNFRFGWKKNRISLQVGQPLDMVAIAGSRPYTHETLRELTTILMKQIAAMLPPEYRGIYA